MGRTGETYLVNREGFMITDSRFVSNAVLKVKVDSEPVREWRERGKEMIGDYLDYRGVMVSGSSAIVNEPEWLLLTEMDFSQALLPIARLRNLLIAIAVIAAAGSALVVGNLARKIVQPVEALSEADLALARGDEKGAMVREEWLPDNEIGELVKQRNSRIRELLERQRELAKEQQARAEASAELERITYSMVHDMRAPLRAVMGFGSLLTDEVGGRLSEAGRTYIERMRSACERMDHLICDLLRYSSLLQRDLPVTAVDVQSLLLDLIEKHPVFREKRKQIEVAECMPKVSANGVALAECLTALLDNALKYGKPGVPVIVKVSAETNANCVKIVVDDNGAGVPESLKKKAFDIFQRGSNTSTGTGIGLAVVRAAAERMGGRVGLESELGKGSRFWIELRRVEG
jgi:signal transduction histidine kinase